MPTPQISYEFIAEKVRVMKDTYPSLRSKSDAHVFSALCVKSNFYKNPALILNEAEFADIIVDGQHDGGVDFLLSDPNTEGADLVIGQSKFYAAIQYDDVLNAMIKMALFYKDMVRGQYEQVNAARPGGRGGSRPACLFEWKRFRACSHKRSRTFLGRFSSSSALKNLEVRQYICHFLPGI